MSLENANKKLEEFMEKTKKSLDYRRGYRDGALGMDARTAVKTHGMERVTLNYWIGRTQAVKDMLTGANSN